MIKAGRFGAEHFRKKIGTFNPFAFAAGAMVIILVVLAVYFLMLMSH